MTYPGTIEDLDLLPDATAEEERTLPTLEELDRRECEAREAKEAAR